MKNNHSRSNTFNKHIDESYVYYCQLFICNTAHSLFILPLLLSCERNTTITSLEETPAPSEMLPQSEERSILSLLLILIYHRNEVIRRKDPIPKCRCLIHEIADLESTGDLSQARVNRRLLIKAVI
jgi:hypothetical protein